MEYQRLHRGDLHMIALNKKDGKIVATVDNQELNVDVHAVSPHWMSLFVGNRSFDVYLAQADGKQYVSIQGEHYCFLLPEEEADVGAAGAKGATVETKLTVTAPMPGSVLKIHVGKDDLVTEGQCLAIVEAMKMETGLHATIDGRVKRVCVTEGQQVDAGELLIELEEVSS